MSLTITLGKGALLALGFGTSDAVLLYNLGRRFGNWLTATDDDQTLLKLLDCDELDLLRRQGVIDLKAFNQRWSQSISLLANGIPVRSANDKIKAALENLTRFTACMLTIVAILDAFVTTADVKRILQNLLIRLFSATSEGELILSTEIDTRINAWRSAACVRGLHLEARNIRAELIAKGRIQDGPFQLKCVQIRKI